MTGATLHCFAEAAGAGRDLAALLGVECAQVAVHRFPDGESLVRVAKTAPTAFLYRALDDPNAKLVEVLLAVAALQAAGDARVEALAVHCLARAADIAAMHAAGIARIRATDSVAGPLAQLPLAPALVQAMIDHGWTGAPRT